jgi:hypothetical protein
MASPNDYSLLYDFTKPCFGVDLADKTGQQKPDLPALIRSAPILDYFRIRRQHTPTPLGGFANLYFGTLPRRRARG